MPKTTYMQKHGIKVLGVSEKFVADYQYFKNSNKQQCDIFKHNKYNFYLVV